MFVNTSRFTTDPGLPRPAGSTSNSHSFKERADADDALKLADILRDHFGGATTRRKLRTASGWDSKKFERIAARAVAVGRFRDVLVPCTVSKNKTEDVPGYELVTTTGEAK